MARTRAETAAALAPLCASDRYPQLTSDDLLRIVDSVLRVSTHAVSTAYAVGDVVIPSTPNGRRYRCLIAGTSASTAPEWPTSDVALYPGYRIGETTGDIVWQDDGPAHQEVYDLNLAAARAWLEKAGLASADIAVSDQNKSLSLQQVHDHCLAMARKYRPMVIW